MLPEDTKVLEFYQYHKYDKTSFIIYADLKFLTENTDRCKNNPEKLFTTKVGKHIASGFSNSTILSFKDLEKSMMNTEIKTA